LVDPPYRNRIDLLTVLEARFRVSHPGEMVRHRLRRLNGARDRFAARCILACRCFQTERIKARVAELQGHGAQRAAVTLQGLLDEASNIHVKALAKGHYAAAVAALTVLITRYAVPSSR
jgi:hypothetical protein